MEQLHLDFLSTINQVHHITVSNCFGENKIPSVSFVYDHVPDKDMCLIPEKWQSHVVINNMMSKLEILHLEKLDHLKCLSKSPLYKPGSKQFENYSYYLQPEMNMKRPLVIHGRTINDNEQILLKIVGNPKPNVVGMINTICICHLDGQQWNIAHKAGVELGHHISLHRGRQNVRDKSVDLKLCQKLDLPFGFDGHMYVLGQHIDCYKMKELRTCPINYQGTEEDADLLYTFYSNMSPLLSKHFHHEWMAQKILSRLLENYHQHI